MLVLVRFEHLQRPSLAFETGKEPDLDQVSNTNPFIDFSKRCCQKNSNSEKYEIFVKDES